MSNYSKKTIKLLHKSSINTLIKECYVQLNLNEDKQKTRIIISIIKKMKKYFDDFDNLRFESICSDME